MGATSSTGKWVQNAENFFSFDLFTVEPRYGPSGTSRLVQLAPLNAGPAGVERRMLNMYIFEDGGGASHTPSSSSSEASLQLGKQWRVRKGNRYLKTNGCQLEWVSPHWWA
jgi:hypothetical protein